MSVSESGESSIPTVPELLTALSSPSEEVREESLALLAEMVTESYGDTGEALGKLVRDNDGISQLAWLLMDPNQTVRLQALHVLGNLGSNSVDRNSALTKAALLQSGAQRAIFAQLDSADEQTVVLTCATLQNLCHEPAWSEVAAQHGLVPKLEQLALRTDPMVVRYASGALRNILATQEATNVELSQEAAEAIGRRQHEAKLEELRVRVATRRISQAVLRIPAGARLRRIVLHERGTSSRAAWENALRSVLASTPQTSPERHSPRKAAPPASGSPERHPPRKATPPASGSPERHSPRKATPPASGSPERHSPRKATPPASPQRELAGTSHVEDVEDNEEEAGDGETGGGDEAELRSMVATLVDQQRVIMRELAEAREEQRMAAAQARDADLRRKTFRELMEGATAAEGLQHTARKQLFVPKHSIGSEAETADEDAISAEAGRRRMQASPKPPALPSTPTTSAAVGDEAAEGAATEGAATGSAATKARIRTADLLASLPRAEPQEQPSPRALLRLDAFVDAFCPFVQHPETAPRR